MFLEDTSQVPYPLKNVCNLSLYSHCSARSMLLFLLFPLSLQKESSDSMQAIYNINKYVASESQMSNFIFTLNDAGDPRYQQT